MTSGFTPEQKAAIEYTFDQPLAIVACPGSGKTFTLIQRINYLVKQGVKPENILTITFTRMAAQELRKRLKQMGIQSEKMTVVTFHKFGLLILHKFSNLINYTNFRVIGQEEQQTIMQRFSPPGLQFNGPLALAQYEVWKVNEKSVTNENVDLFQDYLKYIRSHKLVDMNEIISLSLQILKHNKEARMFYQKKWKESR